MANPSTALSPVLSLPFLEHFYPETFEILTLTPYVLKIFLILFSNSSFAFFLEVPVSEYFILFPFLHTCRMFRPRYNWVDVDVRTPFDIYSY